MVDPQYFLKTGGYPPKKCPKGHPHFFISPKKQGVLKNHPQFSNTALILSADFMPWKIIVYKECLSFCCSGIVSGDKRRISVYKGSWSS